MSNQAEYESMRDQIVADLSATLCDLEAQAESAEGAEKSAIEARIEEVKQRLAGDVTPVM